MQSLRAEISSIMLSYPSKPAGPFQFVQVNGWVHNGKQLQPATGTSQRSSANQTSLEFTTRQAGQVLGCSWKFLWNNAKAVRFAISCWRTDTSSWMLTLLYAKWLLKFLSLTCFRSIELRPREMPPLLLGCTMSNVKWKSQTKASLSNKNIRVKRWKTNWLQNNEPLFFAKMLQSDYGLIFRRKNSDFRHSVATSPSLSWPSATTTTAKLRD